MKKTRIWLFAAFLYVLFSASPFHALAATTYYVDTAAGNNSNTGLSWGQAFAQMVKAEAVAADGDTVRVKSGTYVEPSTAGGATGNMIFTKAITWIADDGLGGQGSVIMQRASGTTVMQFAGTKATSWNGFTFDGQNTATYDALGSSAPQSNKTWTNVTFKDSTSYQLRFFSTAGTNNVCANCTFTGAGSYGIYSDNSPVVLTNPTFTLTTSSAIGVYGFNSLTGSISITGGSGTTTGTMRLISNQTPSVTISGFTLNSTSSNAPIYTATSSTLTISNLVATSTGSLVSLSSGSSAVNLSNSTTTIGAALISPNVTNIAPWTISGNTIIYSTTTPSFIISRTFNPTFTVAATTTISNNTIIANSPFTYGFYILDINGPVVVTNNNITLGSGAAGSGNILDITDVTTPTVSYNTITNLYATAAAPIHVATNGASFTGTAYIGYNTVTSNNTSGYMIGLGTEDAGATGLYANHYNGSVIEYNTIHGPVYNGQASGGNTHGIFVGAQASVYVRHNTVWGSGYGTILKANNTVDWNHTGGVYDNLYIANTYNAGTYVKGVKNSDIFNNTIIESQTHPSDSGDIVEIDNNSSYTTSSNGQGTHFFNNIVFGTANSNMVQVDSTSTLGTLLYNNLYYNYDGSPSTQNFVWGGTTYPGLTAWAAASGDTSTFGDPKLTSSPNDLSLLSTSAAIDAGTSTPAAIALTTDFASNPIYGTPDIGAYEYQPPYTIGSTLLDPTGNIRIYGDGKFRYTTAPTGSATVNLSASHTDGTWSYGASTIRPQWFDISNISWGSTKQWTVSSATATSSNFTLSGLTTNGLFNVTLDSATSNAITGSSCTGGACQADGSGNLALTYTGDFLNHIFAVAPTSITISPSSLPSGTRGNSYSQTLSASTGVAPYTFAVTSGSLPSGLTLSSGGSISGTVSNDAATASFTVTVTDANANTASASYSITIPAKVGGNGPIVGTYGIVAPFVSNVAPVIAAAPQPTSTIPAVPTVSAVPQYQFTRNLSYRMKGADVRELQKYLNAHGFLVMKSGLGSPGQETTLFGLATYAAVKAFQEAHAAQTLTPAGLVRGSGYFGPLTREYVNKGQ